MSTKICSLPQVMLSTFGSFPIDENDLPVH